MKNITLFGSNMRSYNETKEEELTRKVEERQTNIMTALQKFSPIFEYLVNKESSEYKEMRLQEIIKGAINMKVL